MRLGLHIPPFDELADPALVARLCADAERPGVPIWVAGFHGKSRPLRRALRYQGFFPVGIQHPDQLAETAAELRRLRRETSDGAAEPFDIAVELDPRSDPAPYAVAGATWGLVAFPWDPVSVDQVRGVIREGPPPVPKRSNSRV
jgi:hypothetical protein